MTVKLWWPEISYVKGKRFKHRMQFEGEWALVRSMCVIARGPYPLMGPSPLSSELDSVKFIHVVAGSWITNRCFGSVILQSQNHIMGDVHRIA